MKRFGAFLFASVAYAAMFNPSFGVLLFPCNNQAMDKCTLATKQ
jgi:hypothetical protein